MPADDTPAARSAVTARLRAAGCVYAEDEADLLISAARDEAELAALVDRRAAGQPLEHVLGWAEFCGLRIAVDPAVFVPRRRTEFLVAQAIELARPGAVVVDLCCGSGALAAALASAVDGAEVHAADIDPAAVRCARRNLAGLGGQVYQGDLFGPLPLACSAGWTSCWPMCRTCPPARWGCCRRKPVTMRRGWPWTAARTAWNSCGGWPARHRDGWHPAAICCRRSASARRPRPLWRSRPPG